MTEERWSAVRGKGGSRTAPTGCEDGPRGGGRMRVLRQAQHERNPKGDRFWRAGRLRFLAPRRRALRNPIYPSHLPLILTFSHKWRRDQIVSISQSYHSNSKVSRRHSNRDHGCSPNDSRRAPHAAPQIGRSETHLQHTNDRERWSAERAKGGSTGSPRTGWAPSTLSGHE